MRKHLILIGILAFSMWCQQLNAQQAFSDEVVNGMMPYTKGEIKQHFAFVNSYGLKNYSPAELNACKGAAQKVTAIMLNWLKNNPPQGYETLINTFIDVLPDNSYNSPFDDPHPKVYAKIEFHFAPYVHTLKGKFANYEVGTWVTVFLNGMDNNTFGVPITGNIYVIPRKAADFHDLGIYQTAGEEVTMKSRNNVSVFIPVTQEMYLKEAIKGQKQEKLNTGITSGVPTKGERLKEIEQAYKEILEVNRQTAEEFRTKALKELESESNDGFLDMEEKLKEELEKMSTTERNKPALYAGDGDVAPKIYELTGNYSGLCPEVHQDGCEALVRINPELIGFDSSGTINLMLIQWNYIQMTGDNRDKPRFYNRKKEYDNVHQWNMVQFYKMCGTDFSNCLKINANYGTVN